MLNLTSNTAKNKKHLEMVLLMKAIERKWQRYLRTIIKNQFYGVAKDLDRGVTGDFDYNVDKYMSNMSKLSYRYYKVALLIFIKEAIKDLKETQKREQKQGTTVEDFYGEVEVWAEQVAARNIVKVNNTTKKVISGILQRGITEGLSNREISKRIRETGRISSVSRAERIAITETHTASVGSYHTVMENSGVRTTKDWVAFVDRRTRNAHKDADANQNNVPSDQPFEVWGEFLMFPGDPTASSRNIIRCRCIALYNVI